LVPNRTSWSFCRLGAGGLRRRRLGRRASPQHRADARHQFAQLAGLCDVVVGAEFEADDAVDRACGRRQHDDRHIDAALQVADDRKPVFLRHVEVEHHEIGHAGLDRAAQALAAVAQRHGEAVHLEIIADHLAGRRLVVDNDDVRALGHDRSLSRAVYGKGRALSGPGAVGGHLAAMHVDNALDDRKPEAGRAFAGGRFGGEPLEAAEQPAEVLRRQAGAFVGDADDGVESSWVTSTVILPPIGNI
jgi:hypothetical protein